MGLPLILAALHLFPSSLQEDLEKAAGAHSVLDDSQGADEEDEDNLEPSVEAAEAGEDDDDDEDLPSSRRFRRHDSSNSRTFLSRRLPRTLTWDTSASKGPWTARLRSLLFPSDENDAALEKFIPNYRWTPILSGVVIPFSILLEIPGLTEHWYIRTEGNTIVEIKPNSVILDVALAFSMMCALCANICLVLRFLEKRVKTVTLLTIFFLTAHDLINIICVTTFGVEHRFNDGYTYGQSFWLTVCSTAASTVSNITLITDFVRTPAFAQSGSGLTRKQRALMIIVIVLLVYIAFGALINSFMLSLNFIDGLYFTVVTIETIGFGDIHPTDTGSRVFECLYMVFGVINIGVAVAMTRETVLEGLDIGYRKRLRDLRVRRREARRFRRWQVRWKKAVEWRLQKLGLPVWVSDDLLPHEEVRFVGLSGPKAGAGEVHWMSRWLRDLRIKKQIGGTKHHVFHQGKHLNIDALSPQQLEAAALEAGVPLEMFLTTPNHTQPSRRNSTSSHAGSTLVTHTPRVAGFRIPTANVWPADSQTPTHAQVGRMAAMLTKFAMATTGAHVHTVANEDDRQARQQQQQQWRGFSEKDESPARHHEHVWGVCDCHGSPVQTDTTPTQSPPLEGTGIRIELPAVEPPVKESSLAPNARSQWTRDMVRSRFQKSAMVRGQFNEDIKNEERRAYIVKMTVAWSLFLVFWLVGSAIFSKTEGWSYGIGLYFCVIAFTTTGYGDYAPASPAGRSIFVVWALLGVGTVTILISVIEEAGSSRYKRALHSKSFDSAVAKYREREHELATRIAAYQRPQITREHSADTIGAATEAAQVNAQRELEGLPRQIIRQTRAFHDHVRYFVNHNGQSPSIMEATTGRSRIPAELRELLDEIAQLEDISGRAKREIMEDMDSRNTLLMLSIERALHTLINSAERALAALEERDHLVEINTRVAQSRSQSPSRSASPSSIPIREQRNDHTREQDISESTAV